MKTNTKIILTIILVIVAVFLYDKHKEAVRVDYAQTHNCEWVVYGSHDICK